MNFIKRHIFYIGCGLAAAAGIALAATGYTAMPAVGKELEKAKGIYDGLGRLSSKPANESTIEASQARIDKVLADSEQVQKKAETLYGYDLLVPDVLPNGENNLKLEFKKLYIEGLNNFSELLRAGQAPTSREIQLMEEKIDKEIFQESQKGLDRGATPDAAPDLGPDYNDAGVLTRSGVKTRAVQRAAIQKALSINCYITPPAPKKATAGKSGPPPSFQYHPYLSDIDDLEPPIIDDIWWAQLHYWIQKDIVDAIVKVNDEAGDAATAAGKNRWVGVMPVKEIISIRLMERFVVDDEDFFIGAAPGGFGEALPAGTRNTVFTNSMSGPTYDTIQFTVKLIMDQRDVMAFVKQLCDGKFHSLLRVAYTAVEPNRFMHDKVYGAEPIVNVVLDFETILVPSFFRPLIPFGVCETYDYMDCVDPEAESDEG
ncbi:MAG: hypothetical protein ACPGXK_08175 [Phycisphaerae bacterium]